MTITVVWWDIQKHIFYNRWWVQLVSQNLIYCSDASLCLAVRMKGKISKCLHQSTHFSFEIQLVQTDSDCWNLSAHMFNLRFNFFMYLGYLEVIEISVEVKRMWVSRVGSFINWSFEPDVVYEPAPEPERTSQPVDRTLLELISSTRVELYLPHGNSNWCPFCRLRSVPTSALPQHS